MCGNDYKLDVAKSQLFSLLGTVYFRTFVKEARLAKEESFAKNTREGGEVRSQKQGKMCNLKRGAACIVLLGGNSAPSGNSGDDVPSSQAPNLAGIMRTFRVLSCFLHALASLGFSLSQTKKFILS